MSFICNYLVIFVFLCFGLINSSGCPGKPNPHEVWTESPTLVKSVKNGKLFMVGNSSSSTATYVVHVYGTPYQMGYAQGQLVGREIKTFFSEVVVWAEDAIQQEYPYLPSFLVKIIVEFGLEAALEATYAMTESYIPEYYFEELKGIADASGMEYMDLVRINLIPELVKAHCSMIGAWGKAVDHLGHNNTLYQLRALDWAVNGPFQKYASLVVYHPTAQNANAFANYGFLGLIGTLSGISEQPIGVCEKVWLKYNGTENTFGIPWNFVLRDILQWDKSVDEAVARIKSATRTCSIFVGVGDINQKFRAIEYSYDILNVYDDQNFPAYQNHPRMDGVVFLNKHTQPSTEPCLTKLLENSYGSIQPETLRQITSIHQTGNTHAAVYDYGNRMLYVVAASPFVNGTCIPAYDRQWTQLSLDDLWATKSD